MKKIITAISVMLVTCLMVLALASCGTDAVTIGDNGNWFIGEEDTGVKASGTNATIGSNGNWYIDGTDTGKAAVAKDGTPAEKVTIGENGNWFIGQTDTGVKAVVGKYVVDITTDTELDTTTGKSLVLTVITYSDGTTETLKREVPRKLSFIDLLDSSTEYIKGYKPYLRLMAATIDGDHFEVPVTDDMFLYGKPDFNTAGNYNAAIVYGGKIVFSTIRVVDVPAVTVTDFAIYNANVDKGSDISSISVQVTFSNGTHYMIRLSDLTLEGEYDLNKVGRYTLKATYGNHSDMLPLHVHDFDENNISSISPSVIDEFYIPYNADANAVKGILDTNVIGKTVQVYLHKEMFGVTNIAITVTEDMVDASLIDSSQLGRAPLKITVSLPGVGTGTLTLSIPVKADLSGATLLKTYTNDDPNVGGMLGTLKAYNNGIAELSGMGGMQATYTIDANNPNKVTAYSSGMTLYYLIDNTNDKYSVYVPQGEPSAIYTSAENEVKVAVYSDCVVFGMWEPNSDPSLEKFGPIYSMPTSCIDENNQVNMSGTVITLNPDGSLTMDY